LQEVAEHLLGRTGQQLDEAVQDRALKEICNDD
jgi:hypothetical protein